MDKVLVYDPTASDKLSAVRGIGRYIQILKENFPDWTYTADLRSIIYDQGSVFINPFFNFLQPPLTLKRIAKKQIAIVHDLIPLKYPTHFPCGIKGSIYILLNKFILKNYDLIITDSEASKKNITDILHIERKKIKVIYPCLPQSFFKLKIENFEIKNYCLYVGDATWNKNLINLARAIKLADVNCVFVGKVFEAFKFPLRSSTSGVKFDNGWQSELKEFFELTKNNKRFIFAGFVPDSELIKLYQQASFNILPSRDEGFGFSYLESANFCCPSLLSDIPVLREISNNQALFTNPNNPQDLAEKIKEISSNKILRNKIGTLAKKRSEFFSPEKFKEEILSAIK